MRQNYKFLIVEKIPFLALSIVFSIITFIVQRGSGAVPDTAALPFEARIANALISCGLYIGKMFWPANLAVIYPLNTNIPELLPAIFSALLIIGISLIVFYFARKLKFLFVGWFWFLIILLPVIGLVQSGPQAYADRYTYISYIGLFIIIAFGLPQLVSKLPFRKVALGTSALIALTILGICSYRQVGYWKNSITLFSHATDVTQNNFIAHNHLAHFLRNQGNLAPAIEHYQKSLEIQPDYLDTLFGIGCAYADQGDSTARNPIF